MIDKTYLTDLLDSDPFQFNSLRQTALDHYERCLSEQNAHPLETFVEKQLSTNPLHLELLYDISNDLQQRLAALREYHFDARKKVLQAFKNIYHVDIAHLTPADQLDTYHLLSPHAVIEYVRRHTMDITKDEEAILVEMIDSSTHICAQLSHDIDLTTHIIQMLSDWMVAASIMSLRQSQVPFWTAQADGLSRIH